MAEDRRTETKTKENVGPALRYAGQQNATDLWAQFASGALAPVTRGRVRAYPGLASAAPPTSSFYRAFIELVPEMPRVIDAGVGSGMGSALLAGRFESVVAVDRDPKALAFAKQYAPSIEVVQSALEEPLEGPRANAATVVDVLGQVTSPTRFLTSLRANLDPRAPVLFAEPVAYVAQRLAQPVRRAFSKNQLSALLARSGFHARHWLADSGTFVACVAGASDDGAWQHFARAEEARAADPDVALAELALAARSGRRDVQREAAIAEADLHFSLGHGDAAIRAFLRGAELDAGDARPTAGLSLLSLACNDVESAVELSLRAAELDPTEPMSAIALASAVEARSPNDALGAWRLAARLSPTNLEVIARVAELSAQREDYPSAIHVFERLRAYGDDLPPDFYVTLALLLNGTGRREDALIELRLARALSPQNRAVRELWAELNAVAS